MREAAKAIENAITFEAKKDGLQQKQNGDWMLRVTIASIDMDSRITNAVMGTRFQCVLVEVNDDETPVDHVLIERDKWRDLGPTRQAALRCKEPLFWAFLTEEKNHDVLDEDGAANVVRYFCEIDSRAELSKPGYTEARLAWYRLDEAFQAWKVKEHG